jgi:hypothetical protein
MKMINTCMATLFKGFSTVDKVRAPYTLTDADLVNRRENNETNIWKCYMGLLDGTRRS